MDRGAWQGTIHGVTKSWTWLSDYHSLGEIISLNSLHLDGRKVHVNITKVNNEAATVDPHVIEGYVLKVGKNKFKPEKQKKVS